MAFFIRGAADERFYQLIGLAALIAIAACKTPVTLLPSVTALDHHCVLQKAPKTPERTLVAYCRGSPPEGALRQA